LIWWRFSGGVEGDDCDFGGTVEAEGKAHGADAAVDVELHLFKAVEAFGVFFAHRGQDEGAEEWEANLASVGVTCEHQVDERTARMGGDVVGVVGFVGHEEDGAVGLFGDGEIEVGVAGGRVVDSAEPETAAVALDGDVLVDQNRGAMAGEGLDDKRGVEGHVVVAEDGVTERRGECGEDFGATVNGMLAGDEGEGAVGDEVSGKEDEVGGQAIDLMDDAFEEIGFGVLVEVDVADLDDAISVEGGGQVRDGDRALDYVDLVACNLPGVKGETGGGGAGANKEVASGEAGRLGRGEAGHTSMIPG
jgi:hypothetical protein